MIVEGEETDTYSPPDSPVTFKRDLSLKGQSLTLKQLSNKSRTSRKTQAPTKPPDGGWVAWLVVLGSFFLHFIADGIVYTFGLFYVEISDDLQYSKSATAWVASIMIGMLFCSGPIAAALVNRFGCRIISIVGSIIATLGFGISYFARNLVFLYLSIGVVGGFGLGLMYLPAIVSVTTYFEKNRAFATGVAVAGSGIGTFALSPILNLIIRTWGWNWGLVWEAGFLLTCAFFSILFRPLKPHEDHDEEKAELGQLEDEDLGDEDGMITIIPVINEPFEEHSHPGSRKVLISGTSLHKDQPLISLDHPSTTKTSTTTSPTEAGGRKDSEDLDGHGQRRGSSGWDLLRSLKSSENVSVKELSVLKPSLPPHMTKTGLTMSSSQPVFPVGMAHDSDSSHSSQTNSKNKLTYGSEVSIPMIIPPAHSHPSGMVRNTSGLLIRRKDIFYSGSLLKIQELADEDTDQALLRTPESSIQSIGPKKICGIACGNEFYEIFKTMMDFHMLKDRVFVFFAISNFLTCIGYNVPYIFLPDMAEKNAGADPASAAFLLSIVGISNTVSRIVLGYLSDRKWVNRMYLYNSSLAICGIATAMAPLATSLHLLRLYAVVFGVTVGVFISLTSVILVDLFGLKKLTNAFGLLLLFQGVASIIGSPIVGELYDVTGKYEVGFYVAGGALGLSGLMLFLIPFIKKKDPVKKREKEQAKEQLRKEKELKLLPSPEIIKKDDTNTNSKVLANGINGKIANGNGYNNHNSRKV